MLLNANAWNVMLTLYRVERALGGVAVDMQAPRDFAGGRPSSFDADIGFTETADAMGQRRCAGTGVGGAAIPARGTAAKG